MIRTKHVLHPLRTAHAAKNRFLAHLHARRFASHSQKQFQHDCRYDLRNVTNGFMSRLDDSGDDTGLLERICAAWARAVADERFAPSCYAPTGWWKQVRRTSLGAVMKALEDNDVNGLGTMYRNFFRDRCSTGLVAVPYGMSKAWSGGAVRDFHRHTYLGDALYRLDYWSSQTGGRFELTDLAAPDIGNPFGILIDGALIRTGAEYQHYCAQRILGYLSPARSAVAEIGGGYGGMAYYLLRDGKGVVWIDFDVPESVALASWYLAKTFPSLKFLFYGEKELTAETIAASDVVLMPLFQMAKMPMGSVDVTFSSHAISDLSRAAMAEYVNVITRMTRSYFIYSGDSRGADMISGLLSPEDRRCSDWNRRKSPGASEVEYIYRL